MAPEQIALITRLFMLHSKIPGQPAERADMKDAPYFPLSDGAPWEAVPPKAAGFDPIRLDPVIAAVSRR